MPMCPMPSTAIKIAKTYIISRLVTSHSPRIPTTPTHNIILKGAYNLCTFLTQNVHANPAKNPDITYIMPIYPT